ncbi:MAG: hypothetical protein KJZ93_21240 [Caldilineaceae bacterium]|nr:hypothetical protein [Caldilineaceae bacterium]
MIVNRLLVLGVICMGLALVMAPEGLGRLRLAWAQEQEIFTITATFTPVDFSPLPTPTPTKVIKIANEITHPKPGDAIAGYAAIRGYAVTNSFRRYDVHIAVAGSESWQWLATSMTPVYDDVIHLLDTTAHPDGRYDLRVRALRDDGNYTESFLRRVEIRNARPPTATTAFNELGTALPTMTPTVATPTETPTPEFISNIPDGQGIFFPYNNGVVRGEVKVIGTANAKPNTVYSRYELAIAPANADNWTLLISSTEQVWQNSIYKLDTRRFADGRYTLRLRIVYANGNYDEYQVRNLYIANVTTVNLPTATPTPPVRGIFAPRSNEVISGTLSITGTANMLNFQRWELAWSPGEGEEWALLVSAETPVVNSLIARLDLSLLPPGAYDLRLRIFNWNNQFEEYVVRRLQIVAPTPTPTFTPFP